MTILVFLCALVAQDIPKVIQRCRTPGPLYSSALSEDELQLLDSLMGRLYRCAEAAAAVSAGIQIRVRFAPLPAPALLERCA